MSLELGESGSLATSDTSSEWEIFPMKGGYGLRCAETPTALCDDIARLLEQVVSESTKSNHTYARGATFVEEYGKTKVRVRIYRRGGLIRHLNSFLFFGRVNASRVAKELRMLSFLSSQDIPVSKPMAGYFQTIIPGVCYRCAIATEEISESTNLLEQWVSSMEMEEIAPVARAVALLVVQLLNLNIQHPDLYPGNVLRVHSGELFLIDFDKSKKFAAGHDARAMKNYLSRWEKGCLKHLEEKKARIAIDSFTAVLNTAMSRLGL